MTYCKNCGSKLEDDAKFCPSCGIAAEPTSDSTNDQRENGGFADKVKGINDTPDVTSEMDEKDISDNKGLTILSYLGPLVFIPMFVRKNSKFARFHANQGLTLFIADGAYGIIQGILTAILRVVFPWNWNYGYFGGRGPVYNILVALLGLFWIVFTVLSVIGIINVIKGKAKELPVIGKIKFLK